MASIAAALRPEFAIAAPSRHNPRVSGPAPDDASEPRPGPRDGLTAQDRQHLRRLRELVARVRRGGGTSRWTDEELAELPRLYRHACGVLAALETRRERQQIRSQLRVLVGQAHALLHRGMDAPPGNPLTRAIQFLAVQSPRAIREEWRLATCVFLAFYAVALASWYAVSRDLELAYSLFDPATVDAEIGQLRQTAPDEAFRGNFTFGLGESPQTAAFIMVHNIGVGVVFFTSGLLAPIFLVLVALNARMLGVYTAVAGHWGQAGSISSILWCHGVIEMQAFLLAGIAGMVLLRAWIAPGVWSRREAMAIESRQAWRIMAPLFPMLIVSGVIEGFISPHAAAPVRIGIAVATGVALVLWILFSGRGEPDRRLAGR